MNTALLRKASIRPLKASHILVVDDEENIRGMVSLLLWQAGYVVDCAKNAAVALEYLKKSRVDLVILDVVLPDGDGVHLAKLIKEMFPTLPILLFSGIGCDDRLGAQAKEAGAEGYVSKMTTPAKLVSAVNGALTAVLERGGLISFPVRTTYKYK